MGKKRRKFSGDFKRQVVREIDLGLSLNEAARKYEASPSVISRWFTQIHDGTLLDRPTPKEKDLEKENQQLKTKIGEMVMEIEHLKKMDNYIRRLRKLNTSVITASNLDQFRKGAGS